MQAPPWSARGALRIGTAFVATLLAASAPAGAVVPPEGPAAKASSTDVVPLPGAKLAAPVRAHMRVAWGRAMRSAAWEAFLTQAGAGWQVGWDSATAVPSRVWGPGLWVPGASASAEVAAAAARRAIADHIGLLAPGSSIDDFVLVSNHTHDGLRSVGFTQTHKGIPVVGGQLSVRIKHDRLFMFSSQALPHVAVALPRRQKSAQQLVDVVHARTVDELGLAQSIRSTGRSAPRSTAIGQPSILPLVGENGVLGYRLVQPVRVDAQARGQWLVYADSQTGEPIARRSELTYATANLHIDSIDRHPGRPRQLRPAVETDLVAGSPLRTTPTGAINWLGAAPLPFTSMATGARVIVDNVGGPVATASWVAEPGSTIVWSAANDELADAQLQLLVHGERVREFARTFAGGLPFLDQPVLAQANIDDQCNAYSNGTRIHFFKSSERCANTALLADVIYHEYGHSLHRHALIEGVGAFDGAMSEGISDFLAAAITNDSGMGRGFFRSDSPLREMNSAEREATWPRDIGGVHQTGIIIAGTFWDLRQRLIAELGPDAGQAKVLALFFAAIQRGTDIPSALLEVLAADDDDGDLSNGTPNECAIRSVFSAHGMRTTAGEVSAAGAVPLAGSPTTAPVRINIHNVSTRCPSDDITRVVVKWQPGVGSIPSPGSGVATTATGGFQAELPLPSPGGRVDYTVDIEFADGTKSTLPDNRADTHYQMFYGDTVPLFCTDFEGEDPFTNGWRRTSSSDDAQFEWGAASRARSATDPDEAFSGTRIVGLGLGKDYGHESSYDMHLPAIDVGQYSYVLLQYRRWLAVEDAYYDKAEIRANGTLAWSNLNSMRGDTSSTHHIDKEWRFDSLLLSTRFAGPTLDLSFHLATDQGLAFGGWNLDDVCIVADPRFICGDGARNGGEECDAGVSNANVADTCRLSCKLPRCGDAIVDADEECDAGPSGDATCDPACILTPSAIEPGGCGCRTTQRATDLIPLAGLLWFALRRRRK